MLNKTSLKFYLLFIASLFIVSCATDHITYIGRDNWAAVMSKSAITGGELSYKTTYFLAKNSMMDDYEENHQTLIEKLAKLIESPDKITFPDKPSLLEANFALIELCVFEAQHAEDEEALKYYLSAGFFSYRFLYDKALNINLTSYNSLEYASILRFYNYSMSEIYSNFADRKISLEEPHTYQIVTGSIELSSVKSDLIWSYSVFTDYVNGYDYIPKNFQSHSYVSGIGVPIIGMQNAPQEHDKDLAAVRLVYPFTFLIEFKSFDLSSGTVKATPEFYDSYKNEFIKIDSQDVPLSKDYTLAIAKFIDSYKERISGIKFMFDPDAMANLQGIYLLSPYDPNKIPVLLVHGLMGQPRTWMEMLNTLLSNQQIREHYQFWFYTYPTGDPIFYSEYKFREALESIHKKYDPESKDLGFSHMVLIGHSMGAVLSRIAVQDSEGTKFAEDLFSVKDLKQLKLDKEEDNFIRKVGVFKPIPFIGCVILMAPPNRGSDMATFTFSRIGSSLISLPLKVTQQSGALVQKAVIAAGVKENNYPIPNGIDSLKPSSRYLEYSVKLPFKKDLFIYTIIGNIEKSGEKSGSDGVVSYSSAHLDNATEEVVIKSDHSVQQTSDGIREVTHILLKYLNEAEKNQIKN